MLRLIKNLYGLKDAGLTWHEHLKKGLLERGWKPSDIDPCLFTKGNVILVIYVDDAYSTITHLKKKKTKTKNSPWRTATQTTTTPAERTSPQQPIETITEAEANRGRKAQPKLGRDFCHVRQ